MTTRSLVRGRVPWSGVPMQGRPYVYRGSGFDTLTPGITEGPTAPSRGSRRLRQRAPHISTPVGVPDATLSVGKAADLLGVSTDTAIRWLQAVEHCTTGGHRRYRPADVDRVRAERAVDRYGGPA